MTTEARRPIGEVHGWLRDGRRIALSECHSRQERETVRTAYAPLIDRRQREMDAEIEAVGNDLLDGIGNLREGIWDALKQPALRDIAASDDEALPDLTRIAREFGDLQRMSDPAYLAALNQHLQDWLRIRVESITR